MRSRASFLVNAPVALRLGDCAAAGCSREWSLLKEDVDLFYLVVHFAIPPRAEWCFLSRMPSAFRHYVLYDRPARGLGSHSLYRAGWLRCWQKVSTDQDRGFAACRRGKHQKLCYFLAHFARFMAPSPKAAYGRHRPDRRQFLLAVNRGWRGPVIVGFGDGRA